MISEADVVIFGAPNCHLTDLAPPFRDLGDLFCSMGAPWVAMGVAERFPWSVGSDFRGLLDPIFRASYLWTNIDVFCSCVRFENFSKSFFG